MAVRFFSEEIKFKLPHPRKTSHWIAETIVKEKSEPGDLNFIFCSDSYLHSLNQEYLHHDTFTDIVTFDQREHEDQPLSGDIYISIDRIRENASKFGEAMEKELHRVIIHGVLHLLGYKDKKPADKALMRKKEEAYLSLRK